ncbi:TMhelix containing protein [Vibrio phage 2.117.O._10N.261.45.E9]|nr:TMhelix containing protein [Vibrio phage 1.117.O._10N.261.45.E9]AUR95426.1 TMhelix containing protein [Vibrio phage 1.207.B._10N.222.51.C2]AUS02317.1 TMhelix containing protein [Vibrio phage 2.117.O._10N.261.45.E9]
MDDPDPIKLDITRTAVFTAFAAIGGLLAYVMRTLNKAEKPILVRALVEGLSSGFVGLLAMLLCQAMNLGWEWSGVIVGVFGWLGAESSIMLLTKAVRNKLGITDDGNNRNP